MCRNIFLTLLLSLSVCGWGKTVQADMISDDASTAVIYSYFRISDEDEDPSTISLDDFTGQIEELISGPYNPQSIAAVISAQDRNAKLPPRTVALTFDGIDYSIFNKAIPLLLEKKIPFTLFVSPGQLDGAQRSGNGVRWEDIADLSKDKLATIGLTSYTYGHLGSWTEEQLIADLNRAKTRFREELKMEPEYFAYPFGEYSPAFRSAVSRQGFVAAFGQNSGAVSSPSDKLALPRFTMTRDFADLDRFRMTSEVLPLPATDISPASQVLTDNPPTPGFTVAPEISKSDLQKMTCFASGIGKLQIQILGDSRVEIRFPKGFDDTKGRMNCTLPGPQSDLNDEPRWRWIGFLYTVPANLMAPSP
jgi:peptidoglycan/xylan/chitin deacetylase (PgdA/CDA1 family)